MCVPTEKKVYGFSVNMPQDLLMGVELRNKLLRDYWHRGTANGKICIVRTRC